MYNSDKISIYIHWPFCEKKCPYCDFNSHVSADVPYERFINAYITELNYFKDIWERREICTIFFGGGTPSLAPPVFVEKIINHLSKNGTLANNIEVTLEANPTTFEVCKFRDFKNAGINRLSLGVQSFKNSHLQNLGRTYNGQQAIKAVTAVKEIFPNYSFDLIYCLPWHSFSEWQQELEQALQYCDKHISLYQLTIEKGTQFYKQYLKGQLATPDDTTAAKFYHYTYEKLESVGLAGYEISNHALQGHECNHNLTYWQYNDYLGIGAGAHGRYVKSEDNLRYCTVMQHAPFNWLKSVETNGNGLQKIVHINNQESFIEKILMGLRLKDGLDVEFLSPIASRVKDLINLGMLQIKQDKISATKDGRVVLNSIIMYLLN